MDHVANLMADLSTRFHKVPGTCEQHGPSEILAREADAWRCPKCFEETVARESREQAALERQALLLKIALIPSRYVGQRFVPHSEAQKAVRGTVRLFRDFIVAEPRWASLILIGATGTGKTLLACEIGQSIIAQLGRQVRYTTSSSIIGEVRASYGIEGKSEEGEKQRFAQYDLLIIDEIDATRGSVNDKLILTDIINMRYNNNKPVIAISNQPFESLAQHVGDRVDSRLHENAFVCSFDWPDFRRK